MSSSIQWGGRVLAEGILTKRILRVRAVTDVAGAEEGLVVVHGKLGQTGDHLLHAQLVLHSAARLASSSSNQSWLLQVVLQFWAI